MGFDTKLKDIESSIKTLKGNRDQQDINNSTYTEKVLEDGTIVKVNKTIISETSDYGNSYFFHSTSFHNFDRPEEKFEEFPIVESEQVPIVDDSLNEVEEDNVG